MDRTFAYVPRNTEVKQIAGKIFKVPGSEFKFPDLVLTQPSVSVLSSKDLSLMPPPPIAAPGSLILTPSSPSPSASHSANLNDEMFPVYQVLADKDMASLPIQSVLAVWGLPVRGQSSQKALGYTVKIPGHGACLASLADISEK